MKKPEIIEKLFKGAIVLVGELRGSKLETRTWSDKVTGQRKESLVAHHNIELGGGQEMIRLVEYYDPGHEVTPLGKKGEAVVVFPESVERKNGATVCRASRKAIHRVEE